MNKYLGIALSAVILIVIFGTVPGYQSADGHNFTAYYAIILLGLCFLPVHWTVKAFAGTAAASCIWLQFMIANVTPKELSTTFMRLYISANCDFQFIAIFTGLYALVVVSGIKMETWLNLLCWIALIEVVRISAQRLGWDPVFVPVNTAETISVAAGSQGNTGWTGMVLAMCVPAFFRKRLLWGLIPIAGALYIGKSLTPVLAAAGAIAIIAFISFRGTWRILAILGACFGVILYALYDPGDSARFSNWARAFDLCAIRESWLLGYGLGSWIFLFPEPGTSFHRAHCEPLQVWFELGFVGVLAMLMYARHLISRSISMWRDKDGAYAVAGMAAVIICSLGNFPFHLAGTAVIAVGWMAIFERSMTWRSGLTR